MNTNFNDEIFDQYMAWFDQQEYERTKTKQEVYQYFLEISINAIGEIFGNNIDYVKLLK